MTSHLGVMLLFAACVSAVFGTLLRDAGAEQVKLAARIFVALVGVAYALGWLMYLFFR
jgi:Fe2+ transport system protein B